MSTTSQGRAWPEADALFHSNPRWLGSDDASSIELSPGRILWLFGDTFVGDRAGAPREGSAFPRNTVGIQTGADPSRASIELLWRDGPGGVPGSFFEAPAGTWFWPLHGARCGSAAVVFMMWVRSPRPGVDPIADWRELGALGFFDVFGWALVRIDNPDEHPSAWTVRTMALRESDVIPGASVLLDGEWLLAYAWDRRMRILLARWPLAALDRDPGDPQWWSAGGWGTHADALFDDGATEFSVHRHGDSYVQVQTAFKAKGVGIRRAPRPEGPWSPLALVHVVEESQRGDDVFVYAAKGHPELQGGGLVVTYASNAEVDLCLADQSIYYPRFVRLEGIPA